LDFWRPLPLRGDPLRLSGRSAKVFHGFSDEDLDVWRPRPQGALCLKHEEHLIIRPFAFRTYKSLTTEAVTSLVEKKIGKYQKLLIESHFDDNDQCSLCNTVYLLPDGQDYEEAKKSVNELFGHLLWDDNVHL
jgi:hypothetical protein